MFTRALRMIWNSVSHDFVYKFRRFLSSIMSP
jgi:hypothetical protein